MYYLIQGIILLITIILIPFGISVFINPVAYLYIPFYFLCTIPLFVRIGLARSNGYFTPGWSQAFILLIADIIYVCILIPLKLIILARILGFFNTIEISIIFATSMSFIIPRIIKETKFYRSGWRLHYFFYGESKVDVKVYLISSVFLRFVLLFIITFTEYIGALPFIRDIYAGIVLSIAFDAFFIPFIRALKERKLAEYKKERGEVILSRINDLDESVDAVKKKLERLSEIKSIVSDL